MKKQPDFNQLFWDYFGGTPKKVRYEIRHVPYMLHDMVFLSSLIHDARLTRSKIRRHGARITIPMNRDCWEIPARDFEQPTPHAELHIAGANLVLHPVRSSKWIFYEESEAAADKELWINYLFIHKDYGSHTKDTLGLSIIGGGWEFVATLDEFDFTIRLQDQEVPYLYSDRHRSKRS